MQILAWYRNRGERGYIRHDTVLAADRFCMRCAVERKASGIPCLQRHPSASPASPPPFRSSEAMASCVCRTAAHRKPLPLPEEPGVALQWGYHFNPTAGKTQQGSEAAAARGPAALTRPRCGSCPALQPPLLPLPERRLPQRYRAPPDQG